MLWLESTAAGGEEDAAVSETGSSPVEMVLEEVDREECLALMKSESVGCLAVACHSKIRPAPRGRS